MSELLVAPQIYNSLIIDQYGIIIMKAYKCDIYDFITKEIDIYFSPENITIFNLRFPQLISYLEQVIPILLRKVINYGYIFFDIKSLNMLVDYDVIDGNTFSFKEIKLIDFDPNYKLDHYYIEDILERSGKTIHNVTKLTDALLVVSLILFSLDFNKFIYRYLQRNVFIFSYTINELLKDNEIKEYVKYLFQNNMGNITELINSYLNNYGELTLWSDKMESLPNKDNFQSFTTYDGKVYSLLEKMNINLDPLPKKSDLPALAPLNPLLLMPPALSMSLPKLQPLERPTYITPPIKKISKSPPPHKRNIRYRSRLEQVQKTKQEERGIKRTYEGI